MLLQHCFECCVAVPDNVCSNLWRIAYTVICQFQRPSDSMILYLDEHAGLCERASYSPCVRCSALTVYAASPPFALAVRAAARSIPPVLHKFVYTSDLQNVSSNLSCAACCTRSSSWTSASTAAAVYKRVCCSLLTLTLARTDARCTLPSSYKT